MLVMQNLSRPAAAAVKIVPLCPNCGRSMHLARMAPQQEILTDVQIFRCGECGVSLTDAAAERPAA